jgi:hypothetical protein
MLDIIDRLRNLQIQIWPVDRLLPYVRNARTHTDEQVAQVAASMRQFGWTNPILVGSDNIIIAGHARLAAARKLGLDRGSGHRSRSSERGASARTGAGRQQDCHQCRVGRRDAARRIGVAEGRRLAGGLADMVFTDPPYNVDYEGKTAKKLKIGNDTLGGKFYEFLRDACANVLAVTKGAIYICMSSSELHTLHQAFTDAGGYWSTFVIWAKHHFTLGRSDYQRQYEPILYGWREGTDHFWCGARDQGDIWFIKRPIEPGASDDEAGGTWSSARSATAARRATRSSIRSADRARR